MDRACTDAGRSWIDHFYFHAEDGTVLEASAVSLDPIAEALQRLESGVGPHRILLHPSGSTINVRDQEHWARCHCVLVREDGWTLGAPRDLYDAARELWPRQWVAVIAYANTQHRVVVKLAR